MKKVICIVLFLSFVFGLSLMSVQGTVDAQKLPPTPKPVLLNWIAEGDFEAVSDTWLPKPPTTDWQVVADGVIVSGAGVIAAPCPGARYGWYCKIFQLTASKTWAPLETTTGWAPTTEGRIMSAAYAPAAGKYAIFNMYVGDALTECEVEFSSTVVNMTQGFCLSD